MAPTGIWRENKRNTRSQHAFCLFGTGCLRPKSNPRILPKPLVSQLADAVVSQKSFSTASVLHSFLGDASAKRQNSLRLAALRNSLLSQHTSPQSVFLRASVVAAGTPFAKAETAGSFLGAVGRTLRRQRLVPTVAQQRKSRQVHTFQRTNLELADILRGVL